VLNEGNSTPTPDDDRARRELRRSLLKLSVPSTQEGAGQLVRDFQKPEPSPAPLSCCGGNDVATPAASCCGGGSKRRIDWFLWVSAGLFLAGFAAHYLAAGPEWVRVYGHSCHGLLLQAWWGIAIGIATVAVMGRVPREVVAGLLGRGGSWGGLWRAVGAGVVLDLCNHGILMVGMSLYKRGASLGQTLAFLIASPWNSLSLTLILAALIGWGWMALFIGLSVVVALITGWVADKLVAAGKIPANPNTVQIPAHYRIGPALRGVVASLKPGRENYARLAREGLAGSRMVLRWILFGFVLTGLIRALVPAEVFAHSFGPTVLGLLLTLVATTLLEVCSEGSSPIAADLLTRAHAPGNAFVFLMAGAATDYTEVMSLRATTRSWRATLALPLISTPQVVLIGWLIQHFS
jgi:uncharacterized membrane protein YraQ (UPF0718 family)